MEVLRKLLEKTLQKVIPQESRLQLVDQTREGDLSYIHSGDIQD